jgi:hypothetical protein
VAKPSPERASGWEDVVVSDTRDAWETASEQAEAAGRAVAEAALRHVATSVLTAMPEAVFLEVSFGSFGDGLVAESVHVEGEGSAVSDLSEDVHDALDDLNEYNADTWMPFVVDDEELEPLEADDEAPLLIDLTLVKETLGG